VCVCVCVCVNKSLYKKVKKLSRGLPTIRLDPHSKLDTPNYQILENTVHVEQVISRITSES